MSISFIDLRSDTVTVPTQEMREAMYRAEVGDDGRVGADGKGEDRTVAELESLAAEMLGKEDGLLMASGTMANLVALMTHCRRGDHVAVAQDAHVYKREGGAFREDLYGLRPLEVPDPMGVPDLERLIFLLETRDPRLFCLENTHNNAGGTVVSAEATRNLADAAHSRRVPVHLDGARIFNAAVALGVEARVLAEPADSVQFCLSKGLSAPVGSVLVGSRDFIKMARDRRKLIGGQMRQAGVFAAAGIVALKTMVARLQEDHDNARRLALRLVEIANLPIDLARVQTNMVKFDVTCLGMSANEFQRQMRIRGVLVHNASATEVRLVTHRNVTSEQVLQAAETIGRFASERLMNRFGWC